MCAALDVPVLVKEVGWGMSDATARRLVEAGVAGIDVAGAGGTCWSEVERLRAPDESRANVAAAFSTWGIPTAESIRLVRLAAPDIPLVASGGIRTGVDVAKSLALGADMAGIAGPLLKAANDSAESVLSFINGVTEELRIAMLCAGIPTIGELKGSPNLRRRGWE